MNRRIAAITLACSTLIACGEDPVSDNINWLSVVSPSTTGEISNAIAISDGQGNINLLWQQSESQIPETDNTETTVNDTHVRCTRTNILFQQYSASSATWSETTTVQAGTWRAVEKKEFKTDASGNTTEEFTWQRTANELDAQAKMEIDGSGKLITTWIQDTASNCAADNNILPSVYVASFNGTWSDPALLVATPSNQSKEVDLAVNSGGQAIVAWSEWDSANLTSVVYGSHFDGVETWTTPTQLSGNDSETPRAAINANDNGIVAWRQLDSSIFAVKTRYYDATNQWAESIVDSSSTTNNITELQLTTNDTNVSWVAWVETTLSSATDLDIADSQGDIYINSINSDGTVGTPTNVQGDLTATDSDERNENAISPRISADANSNVTVSWLQQHENAPLDNKWNTTGNFSLWVNRLQSGSWTGAQALVNDSNVSVSDSQLIELSDKTTLAWSLHNDSRDETEQSIYNSSFVNNSWASAELVNNVGGQIGSMSLTGGASSPTAVWTQITDTIVDDQPQKVYAIRASVSE